MTNPYFVAGRTGAVGRPRGNLQGLRTAAQPLVNPMRPATTAQPTSPDAVQYGMPTTQQVQQTAPDMAQMQQPSSSNPAMQASVAGQVGSVMAPSPVAGQLGSMMAPSQVAGQLGQLGSAMSGSGVAPPVKPLPVQQIAKPMPVQRPVGGAATVANPNGGIVGSQIAY